MDPEQLLRALVAADGAAESVSSIPGAFDHKSVLENTLRLRPMLARLGELPSNEQRAFVRSLAMYEHTVGGIGSPTLLVRALDSVDDSTHELFDWVVSNTRSYDFYCHGARSFVEFQCMEEAARTRAAHRAEGERERAHEAGLRRAERAAENLRNAIRRGDKPAVESLLSKGALSAGIDLIEPAARYAEEVGQQEIAQLIRNHP